MSFTEFFISLSFWQILWFTLLLLILIRVLAAIIFSPITRKLDELIKVLKDLKK